MGAKRSWITVRHGVGDETLEATAGEPLLQSLGRGGARVSSECRTGHCGACRKRLVDGEVVTPPGYELRPTDEADGYIHTCVCFPVSNVTLSDA